MRITIGFALALALLLPAAVAAQEHRHQGQPDPDPAAHEGPGMMGGMGMMGRMGTMGGMEMMGHPGPAMLLRLRESLGLADDQVERLETLHAEVRQTMQSHRQAAREAHQRAHAAMQGDDPDLNAHEQALREAADHTVQARQAMARAHVEAGRLLSGEQRQKLDTITAAMREMHQRGRGMRHREMRPDSGEMRPRRQGGAAS